MSKKSEKIKLLQGVSASLLALLLANCGDSGNTSSSNSRLPAVRTYEAQQQILENEAEELLKISDEVKAVDKRIEDTRRDLGAAVARSDTTEANRLRAQLEAEEAEKERLKRKALEAEERLKAEAAEAEAARVRAEKAKKVENARKIQPDANLRSLLGDRQSGFTADPAVFVSLNAILETYKDDPDSVQDHVPEILAKATPVLKQITITTPGQILRTEALNIPAEELARRVAQFDSRTETPELKALVVNTQDEVRRSGQVVADLLGTYGVDGEWVSIKANTARLTKERIIRAEFEQEQVALAEGKPLTIQQKVRLFEIYLRGDYKRQVNGEEVVGFSYGALSSLDSKSALNTGLRRYFFTYKTRNLTPIEIIKLDQLTRVLSPAECNQLFVASTDADFQKILESWKGKIDAQNERSINSSLARMHEDHRERFEELRAKVKRGEALDAGEEATWLVLWEKISDVISFGDLGLHSDEEILRYLKGSVAAIKESGILSTSVDAAAALSSGSIKDLSGAVSFRDARTSLMGRVDGRSLSVNGVAGQAVDLGMPLFVQLKGDVSGAKATEAATGSVAYRLGSTVIGAIQGYANSGDGFGIEGRQLETSVVASHSFGGLFIEGQAGSVSAANVHNSEWSGVRSQLTLGFDTSIVSPFVQISHRQLDRDGIHQLNETTGYVGLDMEVANLTADTYSVNTRLLTKVGYGEHAWSNGSKDLGSTAGVRGSVEWTGGMNLNSGISFSTNLGLDTLSGSSAGLKVSLDR